MTIDTSTCLSTSSPVHRSEFSPSSRVHLPELRRLLPSLVLAHYRFSFSSSSSSPYCLASVIIEQLLIIITMLLSTCYHRTVLFSLHLVAQHLLSSEGFVCFAPCCSALVIIGRSFLHFDAQHLLLRCQLLLPPGSVVNQ